MKIVINRQYGGFGLSRPAFLKLRERGHAMALEEADVGEKWSDNSGVRAEFLGRSFLNDIPRDDAALVQIVEEMGDAANGEYAALEIVEIPDDVEWVIDDYDGVETIHEKHRSWS